MKIHFQVLGLTLFLLVMLAQPAPSGSPVWASSSPALVPDDGYWDDKFAASGINGIVRSVGVGDTSIFAGGNFVQAGSLNVLDVARWDGTSWSALGNGISSGDVNRVAVNGTDVYVGGAFDLAGGTHPTLFAKWNTNTGSWVAMGDGLDGYVYAVTSNGSDLYIGGEFTHASSNTVNHIAKWNSTTGKWEALAGGVDGPVTTIAIDTGSLYVGGQFLTAGDKSAVGIARWDGSTWSSLGSDLTGTVYTIAPVAGAVYVGGAFTVAGNVSASNLAKWDQSTQTWFALGTGINGWARAMAVSGNDVYVGGSFTTAGGINANHVAKWDTMTNKWSFLGSGVNDTVWDMAIGSQGDVFLGGEFTMAGGKPSNHIARWDKAAGVAIIVDTTALEVPPVDDGNCTLGEAIRAANTDTAIDACPAGSGDDTIILPAGNYDLTLTDDGGINNTGLPYVTSNITIQGDGAASTVIRRTASDSTPFRLFYVSADGNLTLEGMSLGGGRLSDPNSDVHGGAILNDGALEIRSSIFSNNTAGYGGAITNNGNMNVGDTSFSGNTADGGSGGGIYNSGTGDMANVSITGGTAQRGGGIYSSGTLTVTQSIVSDNTATGVAGGIENRGMMTLDKVGVNDNAAPAAAGIVNERALTLTHVTVDGNKATGDVVGGLDNQIDSIVVGTNITVTNNTAVTTAGGIGNGGTMILTNATIGSNSAFYNAGILNDSYGSLRLNDSTISGNTGQDGGGIGNGGNVTLTNVTISGNTASKGAGGGIETTGTITATNVTLSGNRAIEGGGIYVMSGSVRLKNSIVANSPTGGNCSGQITSSGHNLSSDDACASYFTSTGDLNNVDPLLGPLQDNGGPTLTHALLSGSPAIDTGDNSRCPPTDQRGVARPFDGDYDSVAICDIGAYEFNQPAPKPTSTNTPTATATRTPTRTATSTATGTPPPPQTIEDNSPFIQYGGWRGVRDSSASGGGYRVSDIKGDKVTFHFTGASIKWITRKGPGQGQAAVTIDGASRCNCDLYSGTDHPQLPLAFSLGSSAAHTLVITVLGQKNTKANGTEVAVDAFIVGATTTQEKNPKVQYDTWMGASNASASGGSYRYSSITTAAASLTFTGDSINWIGEKGPNYGKAKVTIAGSTVCALSAPCGIDLYNSTAKWKTVIKSFTGLGAGQHTIQIRPLGSKNAKSTGYRVAVDAFSGPIAPTGTWMLDSPDVQSTGGNPTNWLLWLLPLGVGGLSAQRRRKHARA